MMPTGPSSKRRCHYACALLSILLSGAGCGDETTGGPTQDADAGADTPGDAPGDTGSDADIGDDADGDADALLLPCNAALADAVLTSTESVLERLAQCYVDSGVECNANDQLLVDAVDAISAAAQTRCEDAEIEALMAEDAAVSAAAWIDRLGEQQLRSARTLSRHAFGGPDGLLYAESDGDEQACLEAAYDGMADHYFEVLQEKLICLIGGGCDGSAVSESLQSAAERVTSDIEDTCGNDLRDLVSHVEVLTDLATSQADCAAAAVTTRAGDIDVDCGPANPHVAALETAGDWIAVTLDSDVWSSRCGDDSEFSFWVRLGSQPNNIVIDLQGGGACLDEVDCRNGLASGLLSSEDEMDAPPDDQFANDDEDNPFREWTYAFLPYCNQDVFGGGGGVETLDENPDDGPFELVRSGGINVQAASRYVRDAVWRYLDETDENGYQPDDITAMLSGTSAGGFGVYLNHHYLLDVIGWRSTFAFPRVWLSLSDPVTPIEGILVVKLNPWSLRDVLPTYCNIPPCAAGPSAVPRLASRLSEDSAMLVASGQADVVQYRETFHPSIFVWANRARDYYCDVQGTENAAFFLPANTEPLDALIAGEEFTRENNGHGVGSQFEIDGVTLREWVAGIIADPSSAADLVEEGTLTTLSQDEALTGLPDYEAIEPFDCLE